jgi:crossover junction endodeoxyribonuclease RuvC
LIEPAPGGVAVLGTGVISTSADLPLEARIHLIYDGVRSLLEAQTPTVLVLEDLYTEYKFPRTALLMAHARGVI